MKSILGFNEHLECPTLNGIIFPDEQIQLFNIEVSWGSPNNYDIMLGAKTSINGLKEKGDLSWNSCAVLATTVNLKKSIKVIAGEGNYGSDGFTAVLDLKSEKLIWLAFFTCSNPFDEIKTTNDKILVRSTLGCLWNFNLENPINLSVRCSKE